MDPVSLALGMLAVIAVLCLAASVGAKKALQSHYLHPKL